MVSVSIRLKGEEWFQLLSNRGKGGSRREKISWAVARETNVPNAVAQVGVGLTHHFWYEGGGVVAAPRLSFELD